MMFPFEPLAALNGYILHKNNNQQTEAWNKEKIEEVLNSDTPVDMIRALKQLIYQKEEVFPHYSPIPDPAYA